MLKDYEKAVKNIRKEIKDYIKNSGLKSLVVGISGGIDSALCCALAQPVCKELKIPLIGRSITIESNKKDEIDRSIEIGENFCDDFKHVDFTEYYNCLTPIFNEDGVEELTHEKKIRNGNVKARMRMIYLYDLAQKKGGMVLSTDNKTELMVGFWTLHGDVGDYGMIQNLWKTEVYNMSNYLCEILDSKKSEALKKCILAVPTDGLGITNSDLDQLGVATYVDADRILIDYLENGNKSLGDTPIIKRNIRTEFKRINPYNIPREIIEK